MDDALEGYTKVKRGDGTKSFLTYDKAHRVTEIRHVDKKDKLISSYAYEYDDGGYITKETINQDGELLVQAYTYDTLGQVETMIVSDKVGKDGTTTYTYDKNGNRISSKKNDEKLDYIYDTENRLLAVKDKEGLLRATSPSLHLRYPGSSGDHDSL